MSEKPLGGKSYGSIPHLPGSRLGPGDHRISDGQARICTDRVRDRHDLVLVQEKLDGSNVGVALLNGVILPLTRAGYLATTSAFEQHHYFAHWACANEARFRAVLSEGERLCGEWLAQAHGTRYRLAHEPFVAFDLFRNNRRVVYRNFLEVAQSGEFVTPYTWHGPTSIEQMLGRFDKEGSAHGAIDPVEGAVWRVERRGEVDFLAKYMRPEKIDGCYLPERTGDEAV